jgi:hypothetical protein
MCLICAKVKRPCDEAGQDRDGVLTGLLRGLYGGLIRMYACVPTAYASGMHP